VVRIHVGIGCIDTNSSVVEHLKICLLTIEQILRLGGTASWWSHKPLEARALRAVATTYRILTAT
jgi:hypothetical protein